MSSFSNYQLSQQIAYLQSEINNLGPLPPSAIPTLGQVLTKGNVASTAINMSNNAINNVSSVSTTSITPTTIRDNTLSTGTNTQILSSTGTGIHWIDQGQSGGWVGDATSDLDMHEYNIHQSLTSGTDKWNTDFEAGYIDLYYKESTSNNPVKDKEVIIFQDGVQIKEFNNTIPIFNTDITSKKYQVSEFNPIDSQTNPIITLDSADIFIDVNDPVSIQNTRISSNTIKTKIGVENNGSYGAVEVNIIDLNHDKETPTLNFYQQNVSALPATANKANIILDGDAFEIGNDISGSYPDYDSVRINLKIGDDKDLQINGEAGEVDYVLTSNGANLPPEWKPSTSGIIPTLQQVCESQPDANVLINKNIRWDDGTGNQLITEYDGIQISNTTGALQLNLTETKADLISSSPLDLRLESKLLLNGQSPATNGLFLCSDTTGPPFWSNPTLNILDSDNIWTGSNNFENAPIPTCQTAEFHSNNKQIATTEFVQIEINNIVPPPNLISSDNTWTGAFNDFTYSSLLYKTEPPLTTNDTVATTKYVDDAVAVAESTVPTFQQVLRGPSTTTTIVDNTIIDKSSNDNYVFQTRPDQVLMTDASSRWENIIQPQSIAMRKISSWDGNDYNEFLTQVNLDRVYMEFSAGFVDPPFDTRNNIINTVEMRHDKFEISGYTQSIKTSSINITSTNIDLNNGTITDANNISTNNITANKLTAPNGIGTNTQVLSSTGTAIQWVDNLLNTDNVWTGPRNDFSLSDVSVSTAPENSQNGAVANTAYVDRAIRNSPIPTGTPAELVPALKVVPYAVPIVLNGERYYLQLCKLF
jgi:hypothetical protein